MIVPFTTGLSLLIRILSFTCNKYLFFSYPRIFPVSGSATNVANIAVSARIFVNNARNERLWELVLITKK